MSEFSQVDTYKSFIAMANVQKARGLTWFCFLRYGDETIS